MTARLKEAYTKTLVPHLMKEGGYTNVMAVPRLKSVVLNMGVGEATQNIKILDAAAEELGRIVGQKPAIRRAKKAGIQVTAEATPHHFTLTDELLESYDTHLKVNPPLRTRKDIEAIKKGLREGVIDAIASDHAPHSLEEKELEFDYAPFGMIGLETSIGLTATELVRGGALGWLQVVRAMSTAPAEILSVPGGNLDIGGPADFTIIDPNLEWTVRADDFRSLSKNTPFIGRKLQGKAVMTIVDGRIVYSAI